jgi:acyl-homoserine lactone acylase PvdQ
MRNGLCLKKLVLVLTAPLALHAAPALERARWEQEARQVTIVRDDWGIPHVYGKTDADAVFGMLYAQAEDDFSRVETNYINALGRLAEAEGESRIYRDLRMKLFIDPVALRQQYAASPAWLKRLMDGFADGLNYYLSKHPEVTPRVIRRFEPWMALAFTEGSIGSDVERIDVDQLRAFYGAVPVSQIPPALDAQPAEPAGSNGFAIAPSNTAAHHALLLINPHTSFYFRSELQVVSEEGLNAYGAVTWGQFFVYQGFNESAGWMHTSSGVNAVTEYLEQRPLVSTQIAVPYRAGPAMAEKKFTVYRTHHGPIVRALGGQWVSVRLMQEPVKALMQSFLRTKARNYQAFRQAMELRANSSNNTVFADADGDIAYFHGNFIPRRDPKFDWTKPVDGSNPATEWQGLLSLDEAPHLLNPSSGWLYNSNDWPWSAAGPSSPRKQDYPAYVETGGETARGRHAVRVLENRKDFTLDSLIAAAYDSYLPWFEKPIPALLKAWDDAPAGNPLKAKTAAQIALLRQWDLRWAVASVPTSLAVFWGEEMCRRVNGDARSKGLSIEDYISSKVPPEQLLLALASASDRLEAEFGTWKTPWGDINRFQRLNGDIAPRFDDARPSLPVGFTAGQWGSLAAFVARPYPGARKWYGAAGNTFVAVVEFGRSVRAKAVTAGGASGSPASPHFNDQAQRYSAADLREVYFYRSEVLRHAERQYHPGD